MNQLHRTLAKHGYSLSETLIELPHSTLYEVKKDGEVYVAKATRRADAWDRETKSLSELKGTPGIPVIHAAFSEGNRRNYIIMDAIEGRNLRPFPKPQGLKEHITYLSQVAGILSTVHKAGYVHLDVKPDNIIVSNTGARLIDFGEAQPDGEAFLTTNMSSIKKTYWPPEAREVIAIARPEIDIYSIGVILAKGVKKAVRGLNKSRTRTLLGEDAMLCWKIHSIQIQTNASMTQQNYKNDWKISGTTQLLLI